MSLTSHTAREPGLRCDPHQQVNPQPPKDYRLQPFWELHLHVHLHLAPGSFGTSIELSPANLYRM